MSQSPRPSLSRPRAPSLSRPRAIAAHQRLIETALRLFHRDGFHASGIDRILAEAEVSKMTLYKHFPSKDDLILAVLEERDRRFRDWLKAEVEGRAEEPKRRLEILFEVLGDWVCGPDFHGCLFINATAEYGEATSPVRQAAAAHKARLRDWLLTLTQATGIAAPEQLAEDLLLLKEGLIVSAQVSGPTAALATAQRLARQVIAASGV